MIFDFALFCIPPCHGKPLVPEKNVKFFANTVNYKGNLEAYVYII